MKAQNTSEFEKSQRLMTWFQDWTNFCYSQEGAMPRTQR